MSVFLLLRASSRPLDASQALLRRPNLVNALHQPIHFGAACTRPRSPPRLCHSLDRMTQSHDHLYFSVSAPLLSPQSPPSAMILSRCSSMCRHVHSGSRSFIRGSVREWNKREVKPTPCSSEGRHNLMSTSEWDTGRGARGTNVGVRDSSEDRLDDRATDVVQTTVTVFLLQH
jgi:hypothetical protein